MVEAQPRSDDVAVKENRAVSEARKNCKLMILDFRLEPPPQADWLMQSA
ncbi:MAG: hypothetical protein GX811_05210 [Lentisphaerae bacterium]|jgi:hypothetical protein|nr:hypothetical protein [Lentisphaerota bacterium]